MYIIINFIGSSLAEWLEKAHLQNSVEFSGNSGNIAHWQQHVMLNIVIWRPKREVYTRFVRRVKRESTLQKHTRTARIDLVLGCVH